MKVFKVHIIQNLRKFDPYRLKSRPDRCGRIYGYSLHTQYILIYSEVPLERTGWVYKKKVRYNGLFVLTVVRPVSVLFIVKSIITNK